MEKKHVQVFRRGEISDIIKAKAKDTRKPSIHDTSPKKTTDLIKQLRTFEEFTYLDLACIDGSRPLVTPESSITGMIRDRMLSIYLSSMPVIKPSESPTIFSSYINQSEIEENNDVTGELVRRLKKLIKYETDVSWAVDANEKKIYFDLFKLTDTMYSFLVIQFDMITKVCTIIPFILIEDNEYVDLSATFIFFLSKRRKNIDQEFMNESFIKDGQLSRVLFAVISNYVKEFTYTLRLFRKDNLDMDVPVHHSILELNIFKIIMTSDYIKKEVGSLNILNFMGFRNLITDDPIDECNLPECVTNRKFTAPTLSLSTKEWKFIRDYFDKHYANGCNLSDVLGKPRYGSFLVTRVVDSDWDSLVIMGHEYFPELDAARFWLVNHESYILSSLVYVDIVNVSKFTHLNDNVASIQCMFRYMDYDHLIDSYDELCNHVPILFRDKSEIADLIMNLIMVQTVMYDRPERVKCVRTITRDANPGIKRRENNDDRDNSITVERILMPARDAKEYVKNMSASGGDREYVLESWERKGFHRRVPGTNRTVWIEPTTCKRRLPLTDKDKEIEIRL